MRPLAVRYRCQADDRSANLEHPVVQQGAGTLMAERRALWESRGRGEEERRGMAGYSVGSMAKGRNGVT